MAERVTGRAREQIIPSALWGLLAGNVGPFLWDPAAYPQRTYGLVSDIDAAYALPRLLRRRCETFRCS